MKVAFVTCPLCEASCGLRVEVEDNRLTGVRGDADDPLSKGYLCPKAAALVDLQADPDRLRRPRRRVGDRFVEVPWDEALDEAASRLASIQREHGKDAVGLYIGNPTVHSYSAVLSMASLVPALGSRNVFTSNSVDSLPRQLTSYLMYGSPFATPVPDLDRTDYLLVLGANPAVSNGSAMTAPNCRARIKAITERGGQVVVIDPRRTETAELASRHHFIRPGGDALLLAALVRSVLEAGRGSALAVSDSDRQALASAVAPFAPEAVETRVGIDAAGIRKIASELASAKRAACYGRMGTCTQAFGTLATWLIDCLNIVTGNFDVPGGVMFARPALDLASLAARLGLAGHFGRWRSRVSGLPEFNGELPVAALAEEIETAGPGQIRALITHAGNPVLSLPNGGRIERALAGLDFMVAIDIYQNETTRLADLILPPTFGLEHDHYPLVPAALSLRNMAKYSPAALDAEPGSLHDWDIVVGLVTRLMAARAPMSRPAMAGLRAIGRRLGPKDVVRLGLRFGPYGKGLRPSGGGLSLGDIEAAPHGLDLGPLESRRREVIATDDGRIRLTPPEMQRDLLRLYEERLRARGSLVLIGRRDLRSNNSWMHNSARLLKGKERCTLLMHPRDAEARGLSDGDAAILCSRIGEIRVPVEVSDSIMTGVVSLPHGWGHDRPGAELTVARTRPGVNVNRVTDDRLMDEVSGCSVLNGVPVDVRSA